MAAQAVEAVWVWLYGTAAQKATYGRFNEGGETGGFSKDYLQVSGQNGALMELLFPPGSAKHWLRLHSPAGIAERGFVSHSADRAHLAWEVSRPPAAWRMTKHPTPAGPATIPGNPDRSNFTDALRELAAFEAKRMQAYLVAVKLLGDDNGLHLRVYLTDAPASLSFADASRLPLQVASLLSGLTGRQACASASFTTADSLYFDPERNHAAWSSNPPPAPVVPFDDDAAAEQFEVDPDEVAALEAQVVAGDYSAPDLTVTGKSRGSGQRAFANVVKKNYGWRCALTGISTTEFLVASHIVPWSVDDTIRLDPANGICLSTLIDRAFDTGFLRIEVDLTVHVDWVRVGKDDELRQSLEQIDGKTLEVPKAAPPKADYLRRRLGGFE